MKTLVTLAFAFAIAHVAYYYSKGWRPNRADTLWLISLGILALAAAAQNGIISVSSIPGL